MLLAPHALCHYSLLCTQKRRVDEPTGKNRSQTKTVGGLFPHAIARYDSTNGSHNKSVSHYKAAADRQTASQAGRQTDRQTVTGRNGKIETWINRELERQFATELERLRVREIERQRATKTDRKRHSENRLHKTRCKVHACLLPYSIQGQFPFPGRAGASDTTKGAGWSWKHMAMLHVFRL